MRLVSLLLISIATLYANVVGNLSGNLLVNNGALNYNVPLKLPKGIAGYTPQVSLNYNSNGANGYYGQGWSLTGLSAISRCGSNLALDGVKRGVKYTTEDNICLDGQRLVAVSGNNWDEGSEYRTKIESYSKIKYDNDIFTVYTKAGEIKEYSLINQTWYLSSSKDRYNNTITYNYTSNSSEVYLDNISYGDNTIKLNYEDKLDKTNVYSGGYNIQINKRVDSIDIKNGSSILRNYDLSYKTQSSASDKSLVESIKECSGGSCLEAITFETNTIDNSFSNGSTWIPAFVDYWKNSLEHQSHGTHEYSDLIDMNGDGLIDRVYDRNPNNNVGGFHVMLNNGNDFDSPTKWLDPFPIGNDWKLLIRHRSAHGTHQYSDLIDMNGDGLVDRVYDRNPINDAGGFHVMLNNGSGFDTPKKWLDPFPNGNDWKLLVRHQNGSGTYVHLDLIDMNGDGLPDRVYDRNPYTNAMGLYVMLNTGTSFNTGSHWISGFVDDWKSSIRHKSPHHTHQYSDLIDMNGDGLVDRVYDRNPINNAGGFHVMLNNGSGFDTPKKWLDPFPNGNDWKLLVRHQNINGTYVHLDLIDMNGDGLPDRVYDRNPYTNAMGLYVMLNTGTSFNTGSHWISGFVDDWKSSIRHKSPHHTHQYSDLIDMNGDGLVDRVYDRNPNNNAAGFHVMLNNGSGFDTPKKWLDPFPNGNDWKLLVRHQNGNGSYVHSDLMDMNGDGLPDKVYEKNPYTDALGLYVMLNSGNESNKITKITDSFGNETTIDYKKLTAGGIYTKYNDAIYPNKDSQYLKQVVSSVISKTPTEEDSTTNYTYEGLKINVKGLGSLGFAKVISENSLNNVKIVMEYNQNYPLVGMVNKTTTTINGVLLSEATNTYSSSETNGISKIQLDQSVVKNYQDGIHLSTTTNVNSSFDIYGNILISSSSIKDETTNEEFVTSTTNIYSNDETNWLLGKVINTLVSSSAYGDTKSKETSFTYDTTTGILLSQISEPNKSKWIKKSYTYNTNGTLSSQIISGADIQSTTTNYGYVYNGNTLTSSNITNTLGHTASKTYDTEGKVLSSTDANGIVTNFTYDNFANKLSQSRLGVTTTYSYEYDSSVTGSLYKITLQKDGTAPKTTYYNSLGMLLQSETIGFDGRKIISSQKYDKYGNIIEKIKPYFDGDTAQSTYYTYDNYKRLTSTDSLGDNGRVVNTISYDKFTTTATNAKGQSKITTKNAIDKVVKIQEPLGATIDYKYDAQGNLIETKDANDITITLAYDIYGNKTSQDDPDMGLWLYSYNSLDKLVSKTDAKNQTSTITYDTLGRKSTETLSNGNISRWYYDTTNGVGKISKETKEDSSGNILFEKVYTYNTDSRIDTITTTIDNKSFTKTYTYDAYGKVKNKTLPNGFELRNTYDINGYLVSIKSPKTQIADFNRTHFFDLIQSSLDNSEILYRKSIEYLNESTDLYVKVSDYRYIANLSTTTTGDKNTLNAIADQLEANANALKFEAEYYKKQSDKHKVAVDGYILQATNSNAIDQINEFEEFYSQLQTIYNTYSANILTIAAQYAGYVTYESNTNEQIEFYLSISLAALDTATRASQKADNFENLADNYSSSENEVVAYQEILGDKNYNYFYKALKYNASNQVVSYMSGNGLITDTNFNDSGTIGSITTGYNHDDSIRNLEFTYDDLGNLTFRKDFKLNVEQTYTYDNLNRVSDVDILTSSGTEYLDYKYDLSGNITYKSDVGNYTYNTGTHQVISAGAKTLTYDLNGNVLTNDTSSFTYTPFNKPSSIITTNKTVSFYYDMNKKRYKNTKSNDSSTTYYIDKVYENTITSTNNELHKYFIYVNGQVVAIYNDTLSSSSTKYLHYDSLNSVDTITNNLGVVESRMAYKPFGKKLNLDSNGNSVTTAPFTNRGYTGHEHIEDTSFIHMNARIYDSEIARFMSADTMIPYMYNSQSYNRFSYVRNNPLKYIDPTGHWGNPIKKITKHVKRTVNKVRENTVDKIRAEAERFETKHRNELKMAAIIGAGIATGWGASTYLFAGSTTFGATVAIGAMSGAASGFTAAALYHADSSQTLKMTFNGAKSGAISAGIFHGVKYAVNNTVSYNDITVDYQTGEKVFGTASYGQKIIIKSAAGGIKAALLNQDVESSILSSALLSAVLDYESNPDAADTWFSENISDPLSRVYERTEISKFVEFGKELYENHEYGAILGGLSGYDTYNYLYSKNSITVSDI